MSDNPVHYFSPEEVNALIPRLEEHFQNFWGWRESAQSILDEIRSKARTSRGMEESTPKDSAHQQMRQSQAHFLLEQAKKEIDRIIDLGCVVKDLEMGLVDFPHMSETDAQEIFLCWKFGERKVRFWHEVDRGYNSRKPLTRRVPY